MNLPLPLIAVEGSPRERGIAHGNRAAGLIRRNTATYLERFAADAGIEPDRAREAGEIYRRTSAQLAPRVAEMLDGVAEGAGVAPEEIYALNARSELLYGTATECTSIGVLDSRTANGHTMLAQNWDWHPAARPYSVLLATRDERGFTVVTLAEAGMLAKAGLNSAGLGVCVN